MADLTTILSSCRGNNTCWTVDESSRVPLCMASSPTMASARTMEERLVAGLAASLAEHDANPARLDQARREIRRRLLDDHDGVLGDDIVETVLQKARAKSAEIQKIKSSEASEPSSTTNANTGSFSLFASLVGGGLNAFVSWEMIQEQASSTAEKLTMLQKVQYIDDILPDWDSAVSPFLKEALADPEVASTAIRLHRKWFHLTRSCGAEYESMQLDMLENLLKIECAVPCTFLSEQQKLAITTAMDMFADFVDRNTESSKRRNEIGQLLWGKIPTALARQVMVDHDPHASCLTKWIMGYLRAEETINLLTMDPDFNMLEFLLKRAHETTAALAVGMSNKGLTERLHPTPEVCFTLSILRSILVSTRLYRFPWSLLPGTPAAMVDHVAPTNLLQPAADSFCRLIYGTLASNTDELKLKDDWQTVVMCSDALDTMLCGCRPAKTNTDAFEAVKRNVLELEAAVKALNHPYVNATQQLLKKWIAQD